MRIGRYELVRRLAVGGMAEIHLARATGIEGFEKLVVLKRILPQFTVRPDFVAMFLDEARLSAALEHPNIAQVYDIGELGGSYFFTMEYIRGEDVRSILGTAFARREHVPLEHALTIIIAAAAGLHAAHERRGPDGEPLEIVHRDVSPSNVLVSYDGAVKLVDFGVAKAARRRTETRTGTLKGKAAYMSPEQCTAGDIDRRSDVFALGILLYELTTCRRLFHGDTEFAIMSKIVHEDVAPPSQTIPSYPDDLERILMRALSRDRAARYQTAQELQVELEAFARHHRLPVSTVGLAGYMHEVFAGQIRRQADLSIQPGEVAPPDGGDLEVEIEVEECAPTTARGARRRAVWAAGAAIVTGLAGAAIVALHSLSPVAPPSAAEADDPATAAPRARERVAAPADASEPGRRAPEVFAAEAATETPPDEEAADVAPPPADASDGGDPEPDEAAAGRRGATRAARTRPRASPPSRSEPRASAAEERPEPSWNLDAPLPPPGTD